MEDQIPKVVLDKRLPAIDRWKNVLQNLPNFSKTKYTNDFAKFIKPLYQNSDKNVLRLIFEISKRPHLLFGQFAEELEALSEILSIRFELLVYQNIIYELHCAEKRQSKSYAEESGCTGVICAIDGILTLGRNIDFDYNDYWRRYTFNAIIVDESGKGNHMF